MPVIGKHNRAAWAPAWYPGYRVGRGLERRPSYAGRAIPARGPGAAARTVWGTCIPYAGLRRTRRGRAARNGTRVERVKSTTPLSPVVGGVGQRRGAP